MKKIFLIIFLLSNVLRSEDYSKNKIVIEWHQKNFQILEKKDQQMFFMILKQRYHKLLTQAIHYLKILADESLQENIISAIKDLVITKDVYKNLSQLENLELPNYNMYTLELNYKDLVHHLITNFSKENNKQHFSSFCLKIGKYEIGKHIHKSALIAEKIRILTGVYKICIAPQNQNQIKSKL